MKRGVLTAVVLGDDKMWPLRAALGSLLAVLAVLWWFFGADWVAKPGTYRLGVAYICIVAVSLGFHVRALLAYAGMVRVTKSAVRTGDLDGWLVLYAYNQRFRYAVRAFESSWVIGVAVLLLSAVHHPGVALSVTYRRYVLTYFFGTVLATGYLTLRDLYLVRVQKQMARRPPPTPQRRSSDR